MTEHAAFAELPVPWHVAFQEHSRAGCEQVHAVFWSSHLPGPLHINARQGAVYWCRQHRTRGARTSTFLRASRGLARARRLRPVHKIDESAQQEKWGSRIGGEHHGAGLWHLYSTLAAPLASCCLLQRRRRLGCGSSECRWLSPTIYTSLTY